MRPLSPSARAHGPRPKRSRSTAEVSHGEDAMWTIAALVCSRQDSRLSKKGRELRPIPHEFREQFKLSDYNEWKKWLQYDAVERVDEKQARLLPGDALLPLHMVKGYDKHPLVAKSRLVCPGYADPLALKQEIDTDAPTLSVEGTTRIYPEAAANGWRLEQGDVDSAFLNGRYLSPDRVIYFRVPKGGLPAVPEFGWPELKDGVVLRAKKASYDLRDAPLQWYLERVSSTDYWEYMSTTTS